MKKKIGASMLCVLLLCIAYGVEWELIRDSHVYIDATGLSQYSFLETLKAGTIIEGIKTNVYFYESPYDFLVAFNDEKHHTDIEAVIPKGTKDLFDETLLTSTLHRQGKTLFSSNYLEMIKSQNKNSALQIVPEGVGWYIKNMDEYSGPWWKPSQTIVVSSSIFQTVLRVNNFYNWATFYITNIKKNGNRYELQVICNNWYMHDSAIPQSEQPKQGDTVNYPTKLTLYTDGEYIDIFYKDMYLLGSYVIVDNDFGTMFKNFIEADFFELFDPIFPRRADKNHNVGTTCIVAESLRLRKEESTSSATLHTMKAGTKVTILQLGKQQTIDGITANWVQVEVLDASLEEGLSKSASTSVPKGDVRRTTGWCFGGYLLEQ